MSTPSTASSTPTLRRDDDLGLKFSSILNNLASADLVGKYREIIDFKFKVHVPGMVFFDKANSPGLELARHDIDYVAAQLAWYAKGKQELLGIDRYRPKMWERITSRPPSFQVDLNSNYGEYVFREKQLETVISRLSRDPSSRQAVIMFNRSEVNVSDTKDHICTTSLQFLVRQGKLHLITTMRSNELWNGFRFDVAFFTFLMDYVRAELRARGRAEIELGDYIHNAGSFHALDEDLSEFFEGTAHTFPPLEPNEGPMLIKDLPMLEEGFNGDVAASPALRSFFLNQNSQFACYREVMNQLFCALDYRNEQPPHNSRT